MKKTFAILLCLALCCGAIACGTQYPSDESADPIRIIGSVSTDMPNDGASVQSSAVPAESPVSTDVPTDSPAPTDTPTDVPTDTPTPSATPAPTATPAPDLGKAEQFVAVAKSMLGQPYVRGGVSIEDDGGFDPGGFIYYCLRAVGENVRHKSSRGYAEMEEWHKVSSIDDLEVGDLCFFMTGDNDSVNCACIYIGNGQMIYPSSGEGEVITTKLSNAYWTDAFVFARRVF